MKGPCECTYCTEYCTVLQGTDCSSQGLIVGIVTSDLVGIVMYLVVREDSRAPHYAVHSRSYWMMGFKVGVRAAPKLRLDREIQVRVSQHTTPSRHEK